MNFLPCRVDGSVAVVDALRVPVDSPARGALELGIRAEFLELRSAPAQGSVPVRVRSVAELGDHRLVTVALGAREHRLVVRVPEGAAIPADTGFLRFPPERVCLYREGRLVS